MAGAPTRDMVDSSFLEFGILEFRFSFFVTFSAILRRKPENPAKTPPNPMSLATFSHAPGGIRARSGERQLAVSGNALEHPAIRAGKSTLAHV